MTIKGTIAKYSYKITKIIFLGEKQDAIEWL